MDKLRVWLTARARAGPTAIRPGLVLSTDAATGVETAVAIERKLSEEMKAGMVVAAAEVTTLTTGAS